MAKRTQFYGGQPTFSADALPASAGNVKVVIDKLAFEPAEVTINPGDTVEWLENDGFALAATITSGPEILIPPGQTASPFIREAGVVDCHCRFHSNMKGRMVETGR